MAKPEFKNYVATTSTETSPKEAAEITVANGDKLVGFTVSEDQACHVSLEGGVTWESKEKYETASNVYVQVWIAKATEAKSFKPKFTRTAGTTQHFWGGVFVFAKSSGFGKITGSTNTEGAPSLSITTEKANSALVAVEGDWNAKAGAVTYREGAGAFTQKTRIEDGSRYCSYAGYHADAGAAGAKTVGATAPTSQKYTIAAVEIFGEEGTTPANIACASAGVGSAALALTAPTGLPLSAAAGVGAPALALTAPTRLPLAATAGVATASAALTAPTQLSPSPAAGVAAVALALSAPTQLALSAAAGQGSAALVVSRPQPVTPSVVAGISSAALALTAATQLPLAPVAGAGSALVALTAPSRLILSAEGVGAALLALRAPPAISLASAGVGSAGLALTAPALLPLGTVAGIATALLAVTTPGAAVIVPSRVEGVGGASLAITARSLLALSAAGLGGASLAIHVPTLIVPAPVAGIATASVNLTAAASLALSASGLGGAAASLTAAPQIAAASGGSSGAALSLHVTPQFTLISSGQGSAGLVLSTRTLLTLLATGEGRAALALTVAVASGIGTGALSMVALGGGTPTAEQIGALADAVTAGEDVLDVIELGSGVVAVDSGSARLTVKP